MNYDQLNDQKEVQKKLCVKLAECHYNEAKACDVYSSYKKIKEANLDLVDKCFLLEKITQELKMVSALKIILNIYTSFRYMCTVDNEK